MYLKGRNETCYEILRTTINLWSKQYTIDFKAKADGPHDDNIEKSF